MPVDTNDPAAIERLICWMRSVEASVFHSFGYGDEWFDVIFARLAGIPVCVSRRGNMRHWDPDGAPSFAGHIRNVASDIVTVNSRAVESYCAEVERIPSTKIRVIYNGVEAPNGPGKEAARAGLGLRADDLVAGNVANPRPVKGQDYLLRAFRQVVDAIPNAKLVICGDGETRPGLERLRDELELRDHVIFTGFRLDVETVYAALDLYVHSSLSEGSSNAILEAMQCGLAVVATAVGGTAESVSEGVTGLLAPAGDTGRMAAAMVRLLRDDRLRRSMGERARTRAEQHFSVPRMVREYEQLYEAELVRRGLS
jgi:glycosyltransferase involved in cell wall biosynthesis